MLWTRGATRILALAASLTVTEWLRGHLFTGFPWNTFGYALTAPLPLAQIASVIGIWGLTFITILVASTPAALTDDRAETRRNWMPLALGIALLAGLAFTAPGGLHRTDPARRWRASAHHAAEPAAGRPLQLLGQGRGDEALYRSVEPPPPRNRKA